MNIKERLANLLASENDFENTFEFFQIIRENLFKATQSYFRNLVTIIVLVIAFILSSSWINEPISYSFLTIKDPEIIRAIFPGLIGYVFYFLCCYFSMIDHLRTIHDEVAKILFPKVAANNLLDYLKPVYPFYSAEGIAVKNMKTMTTPINKIVNVFIHSFLILTVAFLEAFIIYKNCPTSVSIIPYYVLSSIVGITFILFGIFVLLRCKYINN